MTTAADAAVDAPPRAEVLPGGGGGWFSRAALHTVLIIVCLIWLLPTVSLFVSSLRPANEVLTTGWWNAFRLPFEFTLDNYREVLTERQHGAELPEQPVHHHPGDRHPDPGGGLRRLRLRVDGLPGSQRALHPGGRPAGDPAPVSPDPGPAAQHQRRHDRIIRGCLAGAHGLRTAVRHLPAAQLLRGAAQGDVRIGLPGWRVTHHCVLPAGPSAVRAGHRVAGHLPVHVRLERPAGRVDPAWAARRMSLR